MTVLVYATLVIALASLVFDIIAIRWHFHDRKHLHGGGHANHVAEIVVSKLNQPPASRQDMDTFLRARYPNWELNE
jgi:hypothetical protein